MSFPNNPGGMGGGPPGWGPPPGGAPPAGGGWGPPPGGGYGGPPPGGGWAPPPDGGFGAGPPGGYAQPGFGGAPPGGIGGGPKTESMALASMICGIVSIPAMFCCYAGVPLAIVAIVLGIIGIGNVNKEPQLYEGKGMATAGIITGAFSLLLVVMLLVFGFASALINNKF